MLNNPSGYITKARRQKARQFLRSGIPSGYVPRRIEDLESDDFIIDLEDKRTAARELNSFIVRRNVNIVYSQNDSSLTLDSFLKRAAPGQRRLSVSLLSRGTALNYAKRGKLTHEIRANFQHIVNELPASIFAPLGRIGIFGMRGGMRYAAFEIGGGAAEQIKDERAELVRACGLIPHPDHKPHISVFSHLQESEVSKFKLGLREGLPDEIFVDLGRPTITAVRGYTEAEQ